jgi:ABC-type branched-subunit amino acid transport system ATPase component
MCLGLDVGEPLHTARTGARSGESLVSLRGITTRFGAARVFDAVDLSLEGDEVHALIAKKFTGRPTLMPVPAGFFEDHQADV